MRKPMIVAEVSANHLGSLSRAMKIVDAAADAGADAIKLQTWSKSMMCLDRNYMISGGAWDGISLFDLYEKAWTPWEWHSILFDHARSRGLMPFSAAFDMESVDFLESLGVTLHKIASFEITDLPLIRKVASTGKPMIISTGMASQREIADALNACVGSGVRTLLKCTSAYPALSSDANLRMLPWMYEHFECRVGLSDHSLDNTAAIVATAMGASVIEKHLTLSRADGGPDAGFSLEPHEFADMVKSVHQAAACIGEVKYGPSESEQSSLALRRSLYIAQDMKAGDILTVDNLRTARPAMGLAPKYMPELLGKPIKQDVTRGTPMTWDLI